MTLTLERESIITGDLVIGFGAYATILGAVTCFHFSLGLFVAVLSFSTLLFAFRVRARRIRFDIKSGCLEATPILWWFRSRSWHVYELTCLRCVSTSGLDLVPQFTLFIHSKQAGEARTTAEKEELAEFLEQLSLHDLGHLISN